MENWGIGDTSKIVKFKDLRECWGTGMGGHGKTYSQMEIQLFCAVAFVGGHGGPAVPLRNEDGPIQDASEAITDREPRSLPDCATYPCPLFGTILGLRDWRVGIYSSPDALLCLLEAAEWPTSF